MRVTDILRQHGVNYKLPGEHHHATPYRVQVDCPFCSPGSEHFRMGISLDGRRANCWSCGRHPVPAALSSLIGETEGYCHDLLRGVVDNGYERVEVRGVYQEPPNTQKMSSAHRSYLRSRGFDPDEIERVWDVRGIGISSRLAWRLFIPVIVGGEKVSWTTRSLSDREGVLRYVSAKPEEEGISHKKVLYGEDYVRHAAVIVEGPFDVWRIGPGAVCTFGTSFTQSQINRLVKFPVRTVCFDDEPEAQAQAERLCSLLSAFPGETYNVVLSGKDPAESPEQEITKIRSKFLQSTW